jgi:hypothetical protein
MIHDDYSFQYNQMPHHLLNSNQITYHTLQPSGQMQSIQGGGGSYNNHYMPSLGSSMAHQSYLTGGVSHHSSLPAPSYIPKPVTRTSSSNSVSGGSSVSSPSSSSISSNNNSSNTNNNGSSNNGMSNQTNSGTSSMHQNLHHSQLHLNHSMDAADLLDYDSKSGNSLLNDPAELVRMKKIRGLTLTEEEIQLLAKDRQRKDNHNMSEFKFNCKEICKNMHF